jgi:ketosteroid isomerase-like protein
MGVTMKKSKWLLGTGLVLFLNTLTFAEELIQGQLNQAVAETERAFAKSMADRDFEAFKSFLAGEAIFFSGTAVQRGKQQVADAWEPFFKEEQAPFSWKPVQVEVLASGMLAHSSGPVLSAEGKHVATYNSIWRLDEETGKWLIVFDKGNDVCDCKKP